MLGMSRCPMFIRLPISIHYFNSDRSRPIALRTRKHAGCDRLEVDISQINHEPTFWANVCTYPPLFSAHRGQSNPTNRSFRSANS
jgi:hypothetical protein